MSAADEIPDRKQLEEDALRAELEGPTVAEVIGRFLRDRGEDRDRLGGGPLTRTDFDRFIRGILEKPQLPSGLVMSIGTVRTARASAERAYHAALWLDGARSHTRWYQWRRRRWMLAQAGAQAALALTLWATFGDPDE